MLCIYGYSLYAAVNKTGWSGQVLLTARVSCVQRDLKAVVCGRQLSFCEFARNALDSKGATAVSALPSRLCYLGACLPHDVLAHISN